MVLLMHGLLVAVPDPPKFDNVALASCAAVVCESKEVYLYLRFIIVAAEPPKYFFKLRRYYDYALCLLSNFRLTSFD